MAVESTFPDLCRSDRARLTVYLDSAEDPRAIAIALPDVLAWLASSDFRRVLAIWDWVQSRARRVREDAYRRAALDALKAVLTAETDPIEKRRAATAILRALSPSLREGSERVHGTRSSEPRSSPPLRGSRIAIHDSEPRTHDASRATSVPVTPDLRSTEGPDRATGRAMTPVNPHTPPAPNAERRMPSAEDRTLIAVGPLGPRSSPLGPSPAARLIASAGTALNTS